MSNHVSAGFCHVGSMVTVASRFFCCSFAFGDAQTCIGRLAAVLLQLLVVFEVEVFEFAPDLLVLKLTLLEAESRKRGVKAA